MQSPAPRPPSNLSSLSSLSAPPPPPPTPRAPTARGAGRRDAAGESPAEECRTKPHESRATASTALVPAALRRSPSWPHGGLVGPPGGGGGPFGLPTGHGGALGPPRGGGPKGPSPPPGRYDSFDDRAFSYQWLEAHGCILQSNTAKLARLSAEAARAGLVLAAPNKARGGSLMNVVATAVAAASGRPSGLSSSSGRPSGSSSSSGRPSDLSSSPGGPATAGGGGGGGGGGADAEKSANLTSFDGAKAHVPDAQWPEFLRAVVEDVAQGRWFYWSELFTDKATQRRLVTDWDLHLVPGRTLEPEEFAPFLQVVLLVTARYLPNTDLRGYVLPRVGATPELYKGRPATRYGYHQGCLCAGVNARQYAYLLPAWHAALEAGFGRPDFDVRGEWRDIVDDVSRNLRVPWARKHADCGHCRGGREPPQTPEGCPVCRGSNYVDGGPEGRYVPRFPHDSQGRLGPPISDAELAEKRAHWLAVTTVRMPGALPAANWRVPEGAPRPYGDTADALASAAAALEATELEAAAAAAVAAGRAPDAYVLARAADLRAGLARAADLRAGEAAGALPFVETAAGRGGGALLDPNGARALMAAALVGGAQSVVPREHAGARLYHFFCSADGATITAKSDSQHCANLAPGATHGTSTARWHFSMRHGAVFQFCWSKKRSCPEFNARRLRPPPHDPAGYRLPSFACSVLFSAATARVRPPKADPVYTMPDEDAGDGLAARGRDWQVGSDLLSERMVEDTGRALEASRGWEDRKAARAAAAAKAAHAAAAAAAAAAAKTTRAAAAAAAAAAKPAPADSNDSAPTHTDSAPEPTDRVAPEQGSASAPVPSPPPPPPPSASADLSLHEGRSQGKTEAVDLDLAPLDTREDGVAGGRPQRRGTRERKLSAKQRSANSAPSRAAAAATRTRKTARLPRTSTGVGERKTAAREGRKAVNRGGHRSTEAVVRGSVPVVEPAWRVEVKRKEADLAWQLAAASLNSIYQHTVQMSRSR